MCKLIYFSASLATVAVNLSQKVLTPINVGAATNGLRDTIIGRGSAGFEVCVWLEQNEAEWVIWGFAENVAKPP